jgi:hypothetical protein
MSEPTRTDRRWFLGAATATIAAAELGIIGSGTALGADELSSLGRAVGWLNSPPLTGPGLRGKVVLVNFCTYTCINWLRSLPYVRAWAEKYGPQGLVVIGAHTPEFAFEKNVDNVQRALKAMNVPYPIAIDSDYGIWNGFANHYWPAIYLLDGMGRVRYRQFGEGDYDKSEKMIQTLLTDAGSAKIGGSLVSIDPKGLEVQADWADLRSPETYLGSGRSSTFASSGGSILSSDRVYAIPAQLRLNDWALSGDWTMRSDASALNVTGGRIAYRFHARDVHLVMSPGADGKPVRFRVLIDGQPPGDAHGGDTDRDGSGAVKEQRLYQLIRQPKPIADRRFDIEFDDPGVEAFVFTFG